MPEKEIKIKTPYGNKNWSFVKRVFDIHEGLINTLKECKELLIQQGYNEEDSFLLKIENMLKKAAPEGK